MSAQQRELKAQAGERALEARADLGDDLLQAFWFDLQTRHEVGQQLDERLGVAIERASGHDEGLEVVVACGKRLHLSGGADAPGMRGDARGDLHVVLPRRSALRQDAAEQGEKVLLLG